MPATIDARLVDLIGSIYDAVIDPLSWPTALEAFRQHFEFQMAALSAHDRLRGTGFLQLAVNMPDHYRQVLEAMGDEALDVWGGPARLAIFPPEEPVLTSQVTPRSVWENARIYTEWAKPQKIVDQVGMILARDHTLMSAIGLSVHESRAPLTDELLDQLRLIAPHLSRGVTITGMLDSVRAEAETFQGALEATSAGVVLVAADMRIVYANRAGLAMLDAGDPVQNRSGRLALRAELVPGQLAAAIAAAQDEKALGRRGIGIPSRLRDGTPRSLNVLPLERRSAPISLGSGAAAAVFITDAAAPLQMPADAMRLLYDLTPTEQRVFELVAEGKGTDDIATALGVAPSTIRTHLLSVFNKTDRHSRADLQLLARDIRLPN